MAHTIDQKAADNIRVLSAAMVEKAGSGHPGGAMGGADFMHVLFSEFLEFDPSDMAWHNRDRFFLDPGHMSPMLYGTLALCGKYTMEEIKNFRQWKSPTPGHPERDIVRGIENTSGPLGQGHTMAVGAAIAEKFLKTRFGDWMEHNIYTFISDGGIQEEISQGAGRIAGLLGLGNLIMFYDSNDIQLSSCTSITTNEDTAKKYEAWGWKVKTINGHDHQQIRDALKEARDEKNKPFLIIGKTIMGKGVVTEDGKQMEPNCDVHGKPLSKAGASYEKTIESLGGDSKSPFEIYPDVKEHYEKVLREKIKRAERKKEIQSEWEGTNPQEAQKLNVFMSGKVPEIDYSAIVQKEGAATRAASGKVLAHFADNIENMIIASADLSDSDKTNDFLNKTTAFKKDDFSGKFLQMGVSELTMAAVCNGIAAHGGIFVACGTFFVFSDYMKPAVRLAGLMELPVKYIWTHDAFRVGEDGPTHQPVEHEAQLRLLEQLKNHSGKNSILVLRPADSSETTIAWKMAMENNDTPSALLLSRQDIQELPGKNGASRYESAKEAEKGAYIIKDTDEQPDIILVANGSEVSTLIDGAEKLEKEKHLKTRIVSVISEGLFKNQSQNYQKQIISDNVPVFGMTAGLSQTLMPVVGCKGKVFGVDHFGYSAPYKVLDEKFGFTAENVVKQVEDFLKTFK